MFLIIWDQNGIPAEPGRKAVWEAIWQAGRGPKFVENDEIPYKTLCSLQIHAEMVSGPFLYEPFLYVQKKNLVIDWGTRFKENFSRKW